MSNFTRSAVKKKGRPIQRPSSNIRVSKSVFNNNLKDSLDNTQNFNMAACNSIPLKKQSMICPVSHMENIDLIQQSKDKKKFNRNYSALNISYTNNLANLQKQSSNRLSQMSKPGDCSKCSRHSGNRHSN